MLLTKFLLYLGVLLIGSSSAIHYYLYLRLRDIGKHYVAFNLLEVMSKDYLRNRAKYELAGLACLSDVGPPSLRTHRIRHWSI
jgi:hypothetical protein